VTGAHSSKKKIFGRTNELCRPCYESCCFHEELPVKRFMPHPSRKKKYRSIERSTYTHDLAPCDLFIFPKLKIIESSSFSVTLKIFRAMWQQWFFNSVSRLGRDAGLHIQSQKLATFAEYTFFTESADRRHA